MRGFVLNECRDHLLDEAEQTFAHCLEQTEPFLFTQLPGKLRQDLQGLCLAFKPHRMHTVAANKQKQGLSGTLGQAASMETALQDYYEQLTPEGGLVQRLDYETAGLLLQAPNAKLQEHLRNLQKAHRIQKFYLAWSPYNRPKLPRAQLLESHFFSYGPKGSQMRILTAEQRAKPRYRKSRLCQTRIEACRRSQDGGCLFLISLQQGFRHQVRAQLAQLGFPLCADPIYGSKYSGHGPKHSEHSSRHSEHAPYPRLGLLACGFIICGQELFLGLNPQE